MTPPVVSDAAQRIYDRLRPYHLDDEQNGYLLLHLCEALARTYAKPTELLRYDDTGSGWRRAYDPQRCPAWLLPWLAQHVGGPSLAGLSEQQQRDLISQAPSWHRGSLSAFIASLRANLDPHDAPVYVFEREGSAYRIAVYTFAADTPNPALVEQAIRAQLPAGLVLTYDGTLTAWNIGILEEEYADLTIGDLEDDFATIADVEDHLPT